MRQVRVQLDCFENGHVKESLTLTFDLDVEKKSQAEAMGETMAVVFHRLVGDNDRAAAVKEFRKHVK